MHLKKKHEDYIRNWESYVCKADENGEVKET